MVKIKFFGLFMFFFGCTSYLIAQDRYAVHYKYKPQPTYSLAEPEAFLTQKALDRRSREGVAVDSLDLPVTQNYLDKIRESSTSILYSSKWLNVSVIVAEQANIKAIAALPFVEKVELVAEGYLSNEKLRTSIGSDTSKIRKFLPPEKSTSRTLAINENAYDFQNELIGIDQMHEDGYTGKGVMIAVFDAGFPGADIAQPLVHLQNGQIVAEKNFVRPWNNNVYSEHQHGTNVLSVIASNQPEVMVGGAYDADFFLAVTEEVATEFRVEEYNWVRAAEFADSLGVDIISSSLGYIDFDDPAMNYTIEELDGKTTVISQGAVLAAHRGILVVNSSGNSGPAVTTLTAPADVDGILAIGSVGKDLGVSGFSSRGPTGDGRLKPDLAAFGSSTALILSDGSVGYSSGTSFAAPQIAALAAGLWEAKTDWTKDEIIQNLVNTATLADDPDNDIGHGIPNFRAALYGEVLGIDDTGETVSWKVFPNPLADGELSIFFGTDLESNFSLIDLSGKYIIQQELSRSSVKKPFKLSLQGLEPGLYIIQMQDADLIKQSKLYVH